MELFTPKWGLSVVTSFQRAPHWNGEESDRPAEEPDS